MNAMLDTAPADPAGKAGAEAKPQFRLIRYFSLTSLVGVLIVLAVLLIFYRQFAFRALADHETRDNESLARVFASTLWRSHAAYVHSAAGLPRSELARHPEVARIREDVLRQMAGLTVVKVKIYDLNGLTVFSTDAKQIGEDKSANAGFLTAKAGGTASDITFRDRFDAFEGVINDRNLVSSYVPIRVSPGAPVEGVMEVYSDVTAYVARLERTTVEIVAWVLGCLSLLYLFLYAIVRRADRIIASQGEEVRRAHQQMLRHQAMHDALTGLPNREHFAAYLDTLVGRAKRAGRKCALLYLGVDGLKIVNDSLGHEAGDRILKDVSERLTDCLREADIHARISGDEFAMALCDSAGEWSLERIVSAVGRIQKALADAPVVVGTHHLAVTASIGIAIYPDDGADVAELLRSADAALNHAKATGRGAYQFHKTEMHAKALETLVLEGELRKALAQRQFALHYQPQVNFATGRIVGAEALLRWQHPERGPVSPARFIPVAEERGLIVPIGEWVLREACRQAQEWRRIGLPPMVVAVNLSALQFRQRNLLEVVGSALEESGLAPEYLELELTESAVMQDASAAISTMTGLKALGVKLSLDDFGTGYSSLSRLKRLPLDKVKIDQSFVRGLPGDADDLAISNAIVGMGKALGLRVVAEGVETTAQRESVRGLGCDAMQGYLVAKPLPDAQFVRFALESTARSPEPA